MGNELTPKFSERIKEMISALKNWQEILTANGYPESSRLLEISTLDLQMKLHSISEAELAQFCEAIRDTLPASVTPEQPVKNLGPHFNNAERLAPGQNVIIMRDVKAAMRRSKPSFSE